MNRVIHGQLELELVSSQLSQTQDIAGAQTSHSSEQVSAQIIPFPPVLKKRKADKDSYLIERIADKVKYF